MHEFDLIKKYFTWDSTWHSTPSHVIKSVGDDAAILEIPTHQHLVTSIDTFISGVHFPENTPAEAIGHKALAVNLSDLAAMGATPYWFTLALTLPDINQQWLAQFSKGLKSLAQEYNCFLVGGDTTRGPLSISIQVMGGVDKGRALMRSGAKVGDAIYITGTLGDAAIGLKTIQHDLQLPEEHKNYCQERLNKPTPRLHESEIIKSFSSSCIDISDGFLQDLGHLVDASQCGAQINIADFPLSPALKTLPEPLAIKSVLTGGDDYELLFTIPKKKQIEFEKSIKNRGGGYKQIGIVIQQENSILNERGEMLSRVGYNHF